MSFLDRDDYGYDRTFDYDGDGKLNFYEWCDEQDFYSSPSEKEYDEEEEEDDGEYMVGSGSTGHSSYSSRNETNVSAGKWWVGVIIALIIVSCINKTLGLIIMIGLLFWLTVN